jgi:hypothetical protein
MKLNWKHLVAGTIITIVAIFLAYYYEQLWFLSIIFIGFIYLMVFALLQVAGDPPPRGGIVKDPTVAMMHSTNHRMPTIIHPDMATTELLDVAKKHHISLAISERCPEPILDGLANIETDSQIVSRPRAGGKNHFMREWSKEIEESILDGLANIDTDPQHDHSERIKNGLCPWFATWEYVWPGETEPRRVCSSHMEHVKTNAILCRINLTSTRIADPTSPNNSLIYCEHDMIERRKQAAKAQKPAPGTLK